MRERNVEAFSQLSFGYSLHIGIQRLYRLLGAGQKFAFWITTHPQEVWLSDETRKQRRTPGCGVGEQEIINAGK
jgi:hypothetical protein